MTPAPQRDPEPEPNAPAWSIRGGRRIALDRPVVIGILNVTPDSFSDGGAFTTVERALAHARQMHADGADGIDIGAESTRPGGASVASDEQLRRLLPVLRAVRAEMPDLLLSIDTTRHDVARAALDEGGDAINDVSGLRHDAETASVVAAAGAGLIVMHSRGDPGALSVYAHATYDGDVAGAVERELLDAVGRATGGGIARDAIVIDPGVGFAKRPADSVLALRALPRLAALGFPVLVGASRKRMVASLIGQPEGGGDPLSRVDGTLGVHVASLALGARLFRVHDVRPHRHALDAAWALLSPSP